MNPLMNERAKRARAEYRVSLAVPPRPTDSPDHRPPRDAQQSERSYRYGDYDPDNQTFDQPYNHIAVSPQK